MNEADGVSIIMAVWNQVGYTKLATEFILRHSVSTVPFELIVVDNGSRPDVREFFDSITGKVEIKYIRNEENLGPVRAINQGIRAARYNFVMAIHNDVLIREDGWLEKFVSVMKNDPRIGVAGLVGRKEIYKTGSVNEESLKHNLRDDDLNAPMREELAEVAVVDGLCFVMRRELIDEIGGLDEAYGYMHCYDLDVSLASIAAGFKNVVVNIQALHLGNGGMTRKLREYRALVKNDSELLKRNCRIFARKWKYMLPLKV